MSKIKIFGEELDKACAQALGWTVSHSKNQQDDFYITGEKPVLVSFFKPTQSARQCMRLMLDHGISTEFNKTANEWRAYIKMDDGTIVEDTGKRLHLAVCRCFILSKLN
jgi:Protein of unknown function (DUF2591)